MNGFKGLLESISARYEWVRSWPVARVFLYALLGYWALFCDPFGLSSATDKALSDQLGRFRAFVQPVRPAPITVVSIDYPSIAGLHNDGNGWMSANDWPLTYPDHIRILRDLALPKNGEAAPAAIFYDIFFERPRANSGDLAQLGRVLQRLELNPAAAKVVLAGGGSFVPMSAQTHALLSAAPLAVSAWEGAGDLYPLQAPLDKTSAASAATAATALYQALCNARGEDCRWLEGADLAELSMQWSISAHSGCPSGMQSVLIDARAIFLRALGRSAAEQNPPAECMPVHQVRLAQLYGEHPVSLRPPYLQPGEPFVVLVGNVMPSLNDYVPSPLYGQVAGVYLHANALVNLNEQGQGYVRPLDGLAFRCLLLSLMTLMILWCMRRRGTLAWRAQVRREAPSSGESALKKLVFTTIYIAAVSLGYYGFYRLNLEPQGWLSFAAFLPFLLEVVLAGESNYHKEVPYDQAYPDSSATRCEPEYRPDMG